MHRQPTILLAGLVLTVASGALAPPEGFSKATAASVETPLPTPVLTPALEEKILLLDPEHVSERDVLEVLARAPAPKIIMIQGGLLPVQIAMKSFSKFIIGMGYPEWCARDPVDGAYSCSSFRDAAKITGLIAGYYERDGLRPMLLGHSLGGMQAVKVLQMLAGESTTAPVVWNPQTEQPEARHEIRDPLTGRPRAVTNLQVCYTAALASGGLGRVVPHQWTMNRRLRKIPDSVEEFTGFSIQLDVFGGDYLGFGPANLFQSTGTAHVRNVRLPTGSNHWTVPVTENLLQNQPDKDWINNYVPDATPSAANPAFQDNAHILWAAEVWHSIKRHWVLELQTLIRAKRTAA